MVVGDTMSPLASARSLGDTASVPVWVSNRPGLASVSDRGIVTARSAGGPATIRVIQGSDTAAIRVWVDPKPIARIRLRAPQLVTAGDTVAIVARAVAEDDGEVPNVRVRLSVNDTSLATLGPDGTLVVKTPGVVVITASAGPVSARIRVTVVPLPLGGSRVSADAGEIAAAVSAQDTVRLGRTYPTAGADSRRQAFFRWVRDARRLDARLASMGAVIATSATTARVEFALDLRWKTAFHRPQKRVAFLAEYVYDNGWRLTSLQPTSALPD